MTTQTITAEALEDIRNIIGKNERLERENADLRKCIVIRDATITKLVFQRNGVCVDE